MISIVYPILLMVVFAVSSVWVLVQHERLYSLYKKKKHTDELLTFKDYFNPTRRLGQMNSANSNFGIALRRWKVLFAKYPEDEELNSQASKARRMFFLPFVVAVSGFVILGVAVQFTVNPFFTSRFDKRHTVQAVQAALQKTHQECLQTNTTAAVCNTISGDAQLQSCGDSSCWAAVMHTQYETIYAAKMLVHRDAQGHYEVSDYMVTARQPQTANGSSGFHRQ